MYNINLYSYWNKPFLRSKKFTIHPLDEPGKETYYSDQSHCKHYLKRTDPFVFKSILGVDYDKVKGECKFLILDPHFVGEDDIKNIINKGWCNWKTIGIFKKENFYNLCLPLAK